MTTVDDERMPRLDRWLAKDRLYLDGLTVPGARLLEQRLQIRATADRLLGALLIPAVCCWIAAMWTAPPQLIVSRIDATTWWIASGILAAVVAVAARIAFLWFRDASVAKAIRLRVGADSRKSIVHRAGWVRLVNLLIIVSVAALMFAALADVDAAPSLLVLYAALLLFVTGSVVVLAGIEMTRGALAVDEATLRVDQRWRGRDLYVALMPLVVLFLAGRGFLTSELARTQSTWLGRVTLGSLIVQPLIITLEITAQWRDRVALGRRPGLGSARQHSWWRAR